MDLSPFSIPKIEATKTTHGRACALSKICRILFSSFYPLFSSVFFFPLLSFYFCWKSREGNITERESKTSIKDQGKRLLVVRSSQFN